MRSARIKSERERSRWSFCDDPTWVGGRRSQRLGVSSLETALLIPFIVLMLLLGLQTAFAILAHEVTQYAAFMAARSFQVYGQKTLGTIAFPYTAEKLSVGSGGKMLTHNRQTAAEAVAERIIFESLPWEYHRIQVADQRANYLARLYEDGADTIKGVNPQAVQIDFAEHPSEPRLRGVNITYCMPLIVPGLALFSEADNHGPCPQQSDALPTMAIEQAFYLGREPQ